MSNIVNYHKTQDEWNIQLTVEINSFLSKDPNEIRTMHSKSDNIEIMIGNETDEIIEDFFESLLQKYRKGLEESMRVFQANALNML